MRASATLDTRITLNLSVHFVESSSGAHTKTVMSAGAKEMMQKQTMHSKLFDTYLQEFMWRSSLTEFIIAMLYTHLIGNQPQNTMVVFKMHDSVPSASYSSICNVLRQWSILLIPTYRVYRLYDIRAVITFSVKKT